MTFIPAVPVASGKPYDAVDVPDRVPQSLEDFVEQRAFDIADGSQRSRVQGVGRLDGDEVLRFVEKDAVGSKDVPVWMIRRYTGFEVHRRAQCDLLAAGACTETGRSGPRGLSSTRTAAPARDYKGRRHECRGPSLRVVRRVIWFPGPSLCWIPTTGARPLRCTAYTAA